MKIFDIENPKCIKFVENFDSREEFIENLPLSYTHVKALHFTKLDKNMNNRVPNRSVLRISSY